MFPIHRLILLKCREISLNHSIHCLRRILRTRLPHERRHIVIDGTTTTALEIYETGNAILEHDITRLEIAVQEHIIVITEQQGHQTVELILKQTLVELDTHTLKEAVLEIVQIPHHSALIELTHRVAERKIKMLWHTELYMR